MRKRRYSLRYCSNLNPVGQLGGLDNPAGHGMGWIFFRGKEKGRGRERGGEGRGAGNIPSPGATFPDQRVCESILPNDRAEPKQQARKPDQSKRPELKKPMKASP